MRSVVWRSSSLGKGILFWSLLLWLSAQLVSCGPKGVIYFENRELPERGWHKDSALTFSFPVDDTTDRYSLSFLLKHTVDYPNANLYFFVEIESPQGSVMQDTVNFLLCSPQGDWYGQSMGKSRKIFLPYASGLSFRYEGDHIVRVRQGMRFEYLPAVELLGLQVQVEGGAALR